MKLLELLYEYFYYRRNPKQALLTSIVGFLMVAGAFSAWHLIKFNDEGLTASGLVESVAQIAGVPTPETSQEKAAIDGLVAAAQTGWEPRAFTSSDLDAILGEAERYSSEARSIKSRRDDFNDPNNAVRVTYTQGGKLAVLRVEVFPFPISNTQTNDPDEAFRRELNMLDVDYAPVAVHGVVFLGSSHGDLSFRSYRAFLDGRGQVEVIGNAEPAELAELLASLDLAGLADAVGATTPVIDRRFGVVLAHKPETYPAGFQPMALQGTIASLSQSEEAPAGPRAESTPHPQVPETEGVVIRNGGLNQAGQRNAFGQSGNCRLENGVRRCQ